jgi:2-polyprenyl-3-methyl-5-hydroxy-6-metoxy-1,4-benzoquinol methylase
LTRYAREIPCAARSEVWGRRLAVSDAAGDAPLVLVVADPEALLLPASAARLIDTLQRHPELDLLLPVSNEPMSEGARGGPPFPYVTPSMLEQFVGELAALREEPRAASAPRSPVYLARRAALVDLPPSHPLDAVPEEAARRGRAVAIDPGAYVHRYGAMDGQPRPDLVALLPEGARAVLDVGCARGETAGALRARGVTFLAGIESDEEDARAAAQVFDRVIAAPLDSVHEAWEARFDAVLFGDVLEHLTDPAEALDRVRPWLSPRGVVVASVPNVGHWAVVSDLVAGRFDYVPYSLLSGTHVRFFTRRTLNDLFEGCGLRVERTETVILPASPDGASRLALLSALPGASADLNVAEFLVVARRAGA